MKSTAVPASHNRIPSASITVRFVSGRQLHKATGYVRPNARMSVEMSMSDDEIALKASNARVR